MNTQAAKALVPAVFFDRDGTLMRDVAYCADPAEVEVFEGAADALRRLRHAGFKTIVITNQSGIGRGYFSEADYRAVEAEMSRQLGPDLLDATYFCADAPERASNRRKPGAEMVFDAARDHSLDLKRSFFVGDKRIDAECGRNAGVRTILVQTGCEEHSGNQEIADWIAPDLAAAADIILRHAK
jgi:D,D-heptose 1,7-bisphosphate phosphatase